MVQNMRTLTVLSVLVLASLVSSLAAAQSTERLNIIDAKQYSMEGWLYSVAFAPDGTALAVGYNWTENRPLVLRYENGTIENVDTSGLPLRAKFYDLAFTPDESALIVGWDNYNPFVCEYRDGVIQEIDTGLPPENFTGFNSVAVAPDRTTLMVGAASQVVRYDGTTFTTIDTSEVRAQQGWIDQGWPYIGKPELRAVAFAPDGTALIVGERLNSWGKVMVNPPYSFPVWKWDRTSLNPVDTSNIISENLYPNSSFEPKSVAFSRDGTALIVGAITGWDAFVLRYDGQTLTPIDFSHITSRYSVYPGLRPLSVAFAPDGSALIVGSLSTGTALEPLIWKYDNGILTAVDASELDVIASSVMLMSVAFAPDGRTAIAVGTYRASPDRPLVVVFDITKAAVFNWYLAVVPLVIIIITIAFTFIYWGRKKA
jgi:WD40 repeat protein